MQKCDRCGGEIIFRDDGGVCTLIHLSGGCSDYHGDGWRTGSLSEDQLHRNTCTYESFVNPNAKCPDCGAPVFFYQSQYGGRVFFDELGPPWSKHPCTDNPANSKPRKPTKTPLATPKFDSTKRYGWEASGWSPFIIIEMKELHTAPIIQFRGWYNNEILRLYVPDGDLLPENSPVHIRPKGNGKYELATIFAARSGNHDIRSKMYIAYDDLVVAAEAYADKSNRRGAKQKTVREPQNKPKTTSSHATKKKTAIEIAFGKVQKKE